MNKIFKSCNEICIEADNCDNIYKLLALKNDVIAHKKKYCLVNLRFMIEHIDNLIDKKYNETKKLLALN